MTPVTQVQMGVVSRNMNHLRVCPRTQLRVHRIEIEPIERENGLTPIAVRPGHNP
ncbi:MAG TPA: hypothetical protein VHD85_22635 [Terracidiphilus sp.]|nr:hypothetical protein [Terracidiphilus sp.]